MSNKNQSQLTKENSVSSSYTITKKSEYPTLPFALVYHLARITPEREERGLNRRIVGIHVHRDKNINSQRIEIERDEQLPIIEAEVGRMIAQGPLDTITLTFSTNGENPMDLGVILETGKPPMIFTWIWKPYFGIELVTDGSLDKDIDEWSGVKLAKGLMAR